MHSRNDNEKVYTKLRLLLYHIATNGNLSKK